MTDRDTYKDDPFFENGVEGVFPARRIMRKPVATVTAAALAAIVVACFVSLTPLMAQEGSVDTQGALATKTDMAAGGLSMTCKGQAWGAWSAKCAEAISGTSTVRTINFRTIQSPSDTENTTVVARLPQNG